MMKVKLNRSAIETVLLKKNMSQNMLATTMGISTCYFSQIMCGTRYPSPRLRQRILDALDPLTFDDIFIIEDGQDGDKAKKA